MVFIHIDRFDLYPESHINLKDYDYKQYGDLCKLHNSFIIYIPLLVLHFDPPFLSGSSTVRDVQYILKKQYFHHLLWLLKFLHLLKKLPMRPRTYI